MGHCRAGLTLALVLALACILAFACLHWQGGTDKAVTQWPIRKALHTQYVQAVDTMHHVAEGLEGPAEQLWLECWLLLLSKLLVLRAHDIDEGCKGRVAEKRLG